MQQKLCRFFDQHTILNCIFSFIGVPVFLLLAVSGITFSVALLAEGLKNIWIYLF